MLGLHIVIFDLHSLHNLYIHLGYYFKNNIHHIVSYKTIKYKNSHVSTQYNSSDRKGIMLVSHIGIIGMTLGTLTQCFFEEKSPPKRRFSFF